MNTPNLTSEVGPTDQWRRRLLDDNFARLQVLSFAFPVLGALVAFQLHGTVDTENIVRWWLGTLALAILSFVLCRTYRRLESPNTRRWARVRLASAALNGCLWGGSLAMLLYPQDDLVAQTFLAFVVGGTGASALSSLAANFPALLAFQAFNTLPLIALLASEGDRVHLAMAGILGTFLLTIVGIGRQTSRSLTRAMRLQAVNCQLVSELQDAHRNISQANDELNRQVDERGAQLQAALAAKELSERALRRTERMQAVGRLAGGIAHDFNNVLMGISGFAELVRDSLPQTDACRSDVEEILKATGRASALTGQLLEFAKGHPTTTQIVEMGKRVMENQKMLEQLTARHVTLQLLVAEQPCPVRLAPGQLDQLLVNLVLNASDSIQEAGEVLVSVELATADLTDSGPTPCCLLRVHDTGQGIDEQVLDHLFEPFFSTKGRNGTGLGLATCFGIVDHAGGKIDVESSPLRGTIFSIFLPLADNASHIAPAVADDRPPSKPLRHILVVEDEPMVRNAVVRTLTNQGYTVQCAYSAEQAIERLRSGLYDFELILSDVLLPQRTGLELFQSFQRDGSRARFLFMSGYAGEDMAFSTAIPSGVPLLRKPFSTVELLDAIAAVMGSAHSDIVELGRRCPMTPVSPPTGRSMSS